MAILNTYPDITPSGDERLASTDGDGAVKNIQIDDAKDYILHNPTLTGTATFPNASVKAQNIDFATSVDANGWSVTNYGNFKVAVKKVTNASFSIAGGALVSSGASTNLPVGLANVGSARDIQITASLSASAGAVTFTPELDSSGTVLTITCRNNAGSAISGTHHAFYRVEFS